MLSMRLILVSPYHGGSHQAWAEGYQAHSSHEIELLTLPARYWKWRMHGGAVTLARRFLQKGESFLMILATDMLDLTTFLALTRPLTARAATVLYMHENQLTYPLPKDPSSGPMRRQLGERDLHYAFVNYSSMLAADHIFFNSRFHQDSLFSALGHFLKHFPDFQELETIELLKAKSSVLPVGLNRSGPPPSGEKPQPPLILWNQRWEYDKKPADFFEALYWAFERNLAFRLALCGERFSKHPQEFEEAKQRLEGNIAHVGFAEKAIYKRILDDTSVVLSTAHHEFFGISILEAVAHGAFPILPRRLSYPELIPEEFHKDCFYEGSEQLHERLEWALSRPQEARMIADRIAASLAHLEWQNLASRYDLELSRVVTED